MMLLQLQYAEILETYHSEVLRGSKKLYLPLGEDVNCLLMPPSAVPLNRVMHLIKKQLGGPHSGTAG